MSDIDVILVRPPYRATDFDQLTQEPLGLCSLAAAMRAAGFGVELVDAELERLEADDVLARVASRDPALVGITVMGHGALPGALDVAAGVKAWAAPEAHVTMGGVLPTFSAGEILGVAPAVDTVVRFEGEVAGPALARAVVGGEKWDAVPGVVARGADGRAHANPPLAPAPLDGLPWPVRDLLPAARNLGRACCVSSSRGCGGGCTFCTVRAFSRGSGRPGWTGRRPRDVADELAWLQVEHGVRDVVFIDDDLIGDRSAGRRRAHDLAGAIVDRGLDLWFEIETRPDNCEPDVVAALRAAGLRSVFVGVESIVPRVQRLLGKPFRIGVVDDALATFADLGVIVRLGYIMFTPWSTLDEVETSFTFLRSVGQATPHSLVNRLHPCPGAPLLQRLAADGVLSGDPIGGYRTTFHDDAVARLYLVAEIAVRSLFPHWYLLLQRRARLLTREHDDPSLDRVAEIGAAERDLERQQELACGVFAQGLEFARRGGDDDVVRFSREIRDAALAEVARATPQPPADSRRHEVAATAPAG